MNNFMDLIFALRSILGMIGTCGGLIFLCFLLWFCVSTAGMRFLEWFDSKFR